MPAPLSRRTRPAYLDNVYHDRSRTPSLSSSHRSAVSVSSSVNSQADARYDAGSKYQRLRALTPALEDDNEDRSSLRSFAMSFSFKKPKWRLFTKMHRRNHTASETQLNFDTQNEYSPTRKLSTSAFTGYHSRQNSSALQLGPRSPAPTVLESPLELSSRRCYYSIARNCSGWVIGGNHGDACDSCQVSSHKMHVVLNYHADKKSRDMVSLDRPDRRSTGLPLHAIRLMAFMTSPTNICYSAEMVQDTTSHE